MFESHETHKIWIHNVISSPPISLHISLALDMACDTHIHLCNLSTLKIKGLLRNLPWAHFHQTSHLLLSISVDVDVTAATVPIYINVRCELHTNPLWRMLGVYCMRAMLSGVMSALSVCLAKTITPPLSLCAL